MSLKNEKITEAEKEFRLAMKQVKSNKQKMFVREYLVDLNGKEAAIRAGYSETSAKEIAYDLLHKTSPRNAVNAGMKVRAEKVTVDQVWVLEQLLELHEMCKGRQEVPIFNHKLGVTLIGKNLDSAGAKSSLELIGKHLGMFKSDIDGLLQTGFKLEISTFQEKEPKK